MKKKKCIIIILLVLFFLAGITCLYLKYKNDMIEKQKIQDNNNKMVIDIKKYYNQYVKTNKLCDLYVKKGNLYISTAKIQKDEYLQLEDKKDIEYTDEYFKINGFDNDYYIYYKDVDITESIPEYSERYKKYIVFNKNILTKRTVTFYDDTDKVIYQFNNVYNLGMEKYSSG